MNDSCMPNDTFITQLRNYLNIANIPSFILKYAIVINLYQNNFQIHILKNILITEYVCLNKIPQQFVAYKLALSRRSYIYQKSF